MTQVNNFLCTFCEIVSGLSRLHNRAHSWGKVALQIYCRTFIFYFYLFIYLFIYFPLSHTTFINEKNEKRTCCVHAFFLPSFLQASTSWVDDNWKNWVNTKLAEGLMVTSIQSNAKSVHFSLFNDKKKFHLIRLLVAGLSGLSEGLGGSSLFFLRCLPATNGR